MKQMKVERVVIDDTAYFIRPFGAFTSAGMTATLGKTIGPVLGSIAPVIADYFNGEDGKTKAITDMDFGLVASGVGDALAALDPDGLVRVLRMLLVDHGNISVILNEESGAEPLTEETCNEVFCQDMTGMIALAGSVIKVNFSGFFEKLAARYGLRIEKLGAAILANTAAST